MHQHSATVTCTECGADRGNPALFNDTAKPREPCPACGATTIAFHVHVHDSAEVHEMLAFKAKGERDGKQKVFLDGKSGDDLTRSTGRWALPHFRVLRHSAQ
jgi:hypothetical protein